MGEASNMPDPGYWRDRGVGEYMDQPFYTFIYPMSEGSDDDTYPRINEDEWERTKPRRKAKARRRKKLSIGPLDGYVDCDLSYDNNDVPMETEEGGDPEFVTLLEGDDVRIRSTYSGVRGPKADIKALTLVSNCPVSVLWLAQNFEYCNGKSLPRGFVYDQYVLLCTEHGLEPVNAASFGKLIRSVFPGLKTRRLGTRGNSKYHYNGIYLKDDSSLMVILKMMNTQQKLSYDGNGKRGRKVKQEDLSPIEGLLLIEGSEDPMDSVMREYLYPKPAHALVVPYLPVQMDPKLALRDIDMEMISMFEVMYHAHCSLVLQHFGNFDFKAVVQEMKRFWRRGSLRQGRRNTIAYNSKLEKLVLYKVCSLPPVRRYIKSMDLVTYQLVMSALFPCISKGMPYTMVNDLRGFMQEYEMMMVIMLHGYPKRMVDNKIICTKTLMALYNEYAEVNRLLKAAATTLTNEENVITMRNEVIRSINFAETEERVRKFVVSNETALQDFVMLRFRDNIGYGGSFHNCITSWYKWAVHISAMLLHESRRHPFLVWMDISNMILGAVSKGNTSEFIACKAFLYWMDTLMIQVTKSQIGKRRGFAMPSFYYEYLEVLRSSSSQA